MTTPSTPQTLPEAKTLQYVISWLEGGCDPLLAAKELRALAAQPQAVAVPAAPEDASYEIDRLSRRLEVMGYQLRQERFKAENVFQVLMGILTC